MVKLLATALAGLSFLVVAGTANGFVVLSGDGTPSFFLTDTSPNLATAGNQQFFSNVLGGGTQVVVLSTTLSGNDSEINEFYDGLPGVTSGLFAGALTAAALASANLLVVPTPEDNFTAAEAAAVSAFLGAGGSLFLLGEGVNLGFDTNGSINGLLAALGSALSLDDSNLDIGNQVATGGEIAAHPPTAGVAEFSYGATAVVSGGTPLFFANGGQSFVAVENFTTQAPEPATLLLVGVALGGLGFIRWHRREPTCSRHPRTPRAAVRGLKPGAQASGHARSRLRVPGAAPAAAVWRTSTRQAVEVAYLGKL